MAEKDEFSEYDREQLAVLGIRPVSPLAVRLWAAGGSMLVFDLLSPISQTLWMWWSAHLATHFDLLECLDQVI